MSLSDIKPPSSGKLLPPLLTPEEETLLLQQACEYRRIKSIESELVLKSPKLTPPLLSVRAQVAGYGTDLDAYELAKENGRKARDALVTRNMGLVHFVVSNIIGSDDGRNSSNGKNKRNKSSNSTTTKGRRTKLNSLTKEDLIQEGAMGLARAADKYNFNVVTAAGKERGKTSTKFSTYATYWIRAAVLRCIAERDDLVRVPEHVSDAIRKMIKAANRLGLDLNSEDILTTLCASDRKEAWKEAHAAKMLALEAGLTHKQLKEAMKVKERRSYGGYVSFEPWMQLKQTSLSSMKLIDDGNGSGLGGDGSVSDNHHVEHLKQTLSRFLRPKEMEALSWRYGLNSEATVPVQGNEKTFRDYEAEAEKDLFGPNGILASSTGSARSSHSQKMRTKQRAVPSAQHRQLQKGGKWGEAMSFAEVGKQMRISAEYGRRLCSVALEKLRRAAEEGQLEPELLF